MKKEIPEWKAEGKKRMIALTNEMRKMRNDAFRGRLKEALKQEIFQEQLQAKKRTLLTATEQNFYTSRAWRELRYKALLKSGGQCECCGRTAHNGIVLHVDHVKPRSKFPELELVLSNLQVLCDDCNLGKSNKDDTDWRRSPKKTYLDNGKTVHRI